MVEGFSTILIRLFACLLLVGVVLLGVACDEGDAEPPTPSPSPSAPPTLAPGTVPAPGVTDTEIRLGITTDLTGAGGTPYAAISEAVRAYFTKVNQENDGVCGRSLTLVARDDQYSSDAALAQTKALVEEDQVYAVIGALNTQAHQGVANYLNDPNGDGTFEDGVPDLFVSTGYSGWGDVARWPWTLGFIPSYQTDGQVISHYINQNQAGKKIGILYEQGEFGNDYVYSVKTSVTDVGLVVSEQPLDPGATDMGPFVTNFVEAGAEVIVLATTPEVTARVITAAHGAGYNPKIVMSYVNSPTQLAALIGGGAAPAQLAAGIREMNGVVSTSYAYSSIQDEDEPALAEHERIMQTFDGPMVSTLSIYGQSLAELVIEAVSRACHNLTRNGLKLAAESIDGFQPTLFLPGVQVHLSAEDHDAVEALQVVEYHEDGTAALLGEPVSRE